MDGSSIKLEGGWGEGEPGLRSRRMREGEEGNRCIGGTGGCRTQCHGGRGERRNGDLTQLL
jgi:hypothetical protein